MQSEIKRNPAEKRSNVVSINLNHGCLQCGGKGASQNGFCLDCTAEGTQLKKPKPNEFRDEDTGKPVDYLLSPEIARIGRNLIRTYAEDFDDIADAEIDYFWKKKGGSNGGKLTLGKCKKVTGELKFYSKKDYLIWLAADNLWSADYFRLTAIVFHELKHCWLNQANDQFDIRNHDLEVFNREIEVFGSWKSDIEATRKAFEKAEQGKLF